MTDSSKTPPSGGSTHLHRRAGRGITKDTNMICTDPNCKHPGHETERLARARERDNAIALPAWLIARVVEIYELIVDKFTGRRRFIIGAKRKAG